jgi:23S rRNA-/tRNA-specific pseudouridylate synthase
MLKPEIIFEDNDVLVINKPAGLIVHSDGRTEEYSVAEWVLENYPEMKDVGDTYVTCGSTEPVHVLFASSKSSFAFWLFALI